MPLCDPYLLYQFWPGSEKIILKTVKPAFEKGKIPSQRSLGPVTNDHIPCSGKPNTDVLGQG